MFSQECETYDVGLIELKKKIDNGPYYQPLPVARGTLNSGENAACRIMGWGETETGQYSVLMREGNVDLIDPKTCWDEVGFDPTASRICAGTFGKERGVGGCQGDGGSPLVCYHGNQWRLYGVQNYYKRGCGTKTNVVMYTRVSVFNSWIDCVLGEKSSEECEEKIRKVAGEECRTPIRRRVALIVGAAIFSFLAFCGMVWAFAKRRSIEKRNKEQYVIPKGGETSLYDDQLESAAGFDLGEVPGPKEGTEQNIYLNLGNYEKNSDQENSLEEHHHAYIKT